jgi:hypothetical protein
MSNVVFVAPFSMAATLRFIRAVTKLPGVRLGLVTQDPVEALPDWLREALSAHWRVANALDAEHLQNGVRGIGGVLGGVDRLIGTLEQLQVPLAQVREALGIDGMGIEAAENFRDKARMKSVLRAAGVPCAHHCLARTAEEARAFVERVGLPVVVKPPAGAGAKATFRLSDRDSLERFLRSYAPPAGREMLFEEFVRGEEKSFDTVSVRGRHAWHSISHYTPSPLEVLENPWIQWCVLLPREVDHPRNDDIREVGRKALTALGMGTGVTHMEWFRRADGSLAISEVAARPPGAQFCTLISYAHDIDFYLAWARLAVHGVFEIPERRYAAGAAYLRGQGRGRVRAIHGLDEIRRELGPLIVETKLPPVGQAPTGTYEGEGYLLVRHESTAVVERALKRIVSTIRIELA